MRRGTLGESALSIVFRPGIQGTRGALRSPWKGGFPASPPRDCLTQRPQRGWERRGLVWAHAERRRCRARRGTLGGSALSIVFRPGIQGTREGHCVAHGMEASSLPSARAPQDTLRPHPLCALRARPTRHPAPPPPLCPLRETPRAPFARDPQDTLRPHHLCGLCVRPTRHPAPSAPPHLSVRPRARPPREPHIKKLKKRLYI